jgi:hypothetical protein
MDPINKYTRIRVVFFLLMSALCLSSCDQGSISETDESTSEHYLVYTFLQHAYEDQVTISKSGMMSFERLEGEEIPESERTLFENELLYLNSFLEEFSELTSVCEEAEPGPYSILTIQHNENQNLQQTVSCSLFDDSGNSQLNRFLYFLHDLRLSLIGEARFDDKLSFHFYPQEPVFELGERLELVYEITNHTDEEIEINFPSGELGMHLYRDNQNLLTLREVPIGASTMIISPGSTEKYKRWLEEHHFEQFDIHLESGPYTVIQFLMDGNSPYISNEITITEGQ